MKIWPKASRPLPQKNPRNPTGYINLLRKGSEINQPENVRKLALNLNKYNFRTYCWAQKAVMVMAIVIVKLFVINRKLPFSHTSIFLIQPWTSLNFSLFSMAIIELWILSDKSDHIAFRFISNHRIKHLPPLQVLLLSLSHPASTPSYQ